MRVTNGGDSTKIGKNYHFLLVIMRVRLLQKVGIKTLQIGLDLKNEIA